MIKLKHIKLENFRSFKELSLDFPEYGLFGIKGGSGYGKSTIFLAISYALGYCPYPSTKLKSWYSDKNPNVLLELEINNKNITIERGDKLKLSIDGNQVKGSSKVINEEISKILTIDPNLIELLTYRKQRSKGLFLSIGDSEKKEFLSSVLGLKDFDKLQKEFKEDINKTDEVLNNISTQINIYQDQIDNFKWPEKVSRFFDLHGAEKEKESLQKGILYTKNLINDLNKKRMEVDKAISASIAEIKHRENRILFKIDEIYTKKINFKSNIIFQNTKNSLDKSREKIKNLELRYKSELFRMNKTVHDLSKKIVDINYLSANISSSEIHLREERAKLEEAKNTKTCSTCKQHWIPPEEFYKHIIDRISSLENGIKNNKIKIQESEESIELIKKLHQDIDSFKIPELEVEREREKEINQKLIKEEILFNSYKESVNKKKNLRILKLELASKNLIDYTMKKWNIQSVEPLEEETDRLQKTLEEAQLKLERCNILDEYNNRFLDLKYKLSGLKEDREENLNLKNELEDFYHIISREGFLGSIFDEVLMELSSKTSEYLKYIPNVSNYSITFNSISETNSGNIKSKIVPILNINGAEAPIDLISGGQSSSVELMVDLALSKIIESRTGNVPGWLMIDEAFEGLTNKEKEVCLDILKMAAQDRLILIVDHSTEVKELYDRTIDVEFDGKYSEVKSGQ
ncbi:MAG: AAA family ATPase [Elusimicrobia bacterium]|nr:AAA family ATPase [Elusimicrobiota bacterium]